MLNVVPIFTYGDVYQDDNELLSELEELDFLQDISDAVSRGDLSPVEGRAMVEHEDELNAVR